MGIQDRDYYREGGNSFLDAWSRQGVTVWLIAITSVVFFAQCITGNPAHSPLVEFGRFSSSAILSGEVWRLVTPLFLHADLWHLVVNMLALYWVGLRVEDVYGSREYLAIYLLAGVFSNGVVMAAETLKIVPVAGGIGASGAVTAIVVLCAFHFPRLQMLLFFVLPMPLWVAAAVMVSLDALGVAGVGRTGIGYMAHIGGALFGVVYYQTGIRFGALFQRSPRTAERRARTRPTLRVDPAEPDEDPPTPVGAAVESQPRPKEAADEQLEARVDQVLEKVSKYGQESLTPEEREILFKASELYKKRRK